MANETKKKPSKTDKTATALKPPKTEEVDLRGTRLQAARSQFVVPVDDYRHYGRYDPRGMAKLARAMRRQWKQEQRAANYDPMRGRIGGSAFEGRLRLSHAVGCERSVEQARRARRARPTGFAAGGKVT